MTIINSVSNTRFSFNGIEYFKNYISVVRGNKIEIFNCYEREDVLLSLTLYSEITLNGTVYNSAADLQSALQSIIYSRATLGGEAVEITEQNNIGKVINIGYLSNSNFTSQVISKINSFTTVLTAVDNPVFFEAFKTGSSLASSAQKVRFQFMGGKGTWGAGGAVVSPSHLYQNAPEAVILDDISNDANGITLNLGQLANENNFIEAINLAVRDFTDIKKNHYINYAVDDITFVKKFSGTPGEYGNEGALLTINDFIDVTNSRIERGLFTPTLKDITNIDPETDVPVTIADNNTGNKTTITGSKIVHTDIDGSTTSIRYEANPNNVEYIVPAKSSDDVFAMQSDVNGLSITANQSASELYLKNAEGSTLATINLGFLNNEGTTFFYNETSQNLELKNDEGDILSEVPVSAFVSNLMQSVNFNSGTPSSLEFKDAEGNVVTSIQITISNILGLQSALNGKFNNPLGTSTQYIRGDGNISNFNNAVHNTDLNGFSIGSAAPITATDNVLSALGKVQGQLSSTLLIKGNIPASADLNTYDQTGIYNQTHNNYAALGTNYPVPYAGTLEVIRSANQLFYQKYHVAGSNMNEIYVRVNAGGLWTSWKKLLTNENITDADIAHWNSAYEWGNHSSTGYAIDMVSLSLKDSAIPEGTDLDTITATGLYRQGTNSYATLELNYPRGLGGKLEVVKISNHTYQTYHVAFSSGNEIYTRMEYNGTWTAWRKLWHSDDLTQTDINNWKNAYNNYVSRTHNNPVVGGTFAGDLNSINKGTYLSYMSTTAIGKPFLQVGGLISVGSATVGSQILLGRTGNELWIRGYDGNYGEWFRVWNSGDFNAALKADLVDGKVPVSQLPSFVDDVLEYSSLAVFPSTGETGKVYIAQDTNKTYRWSGTAYVIIGTDLALGETSATAYRGDRGKTAYDHSQTSGNPHNTQIEEIQGLQSSLEGKANIGNTLTYKGLISLGADFNDYKTTGIYVPQDSETCTNIPSINSGKLEVAIDQFNNAYQTYHDNSNDVHTRTYQVNEGLWSAWEKLSKTSNIIVDNSLTAQQTNASLNSVHSDKPISFILAAPNIDKGKLYIKTSQTRWLSFSGDLLLD